MGEVVVSGSCSSEEEERKEMVVVTEEEKKQDKRLLVSDKEDNKEKENGSLLSTSPSTSSSDVVKWENLLPKMVLRVLLVEPDDSTRQIITALLKKCSYRVAAVRDGLTAWETLKGRPHNIDLVLTEVDLPSISGFALLTLVMEHEVCKNIPVIMMSSQDSISMVLKCMLKGAADFLIKPVRKNELRNLWQHVWRRQMLLGGQVHERNPAGQNKNEAVAENNAASNHSSDHATSVQTDKGGGEKDSDAQSSCTSPNFEAESTYVQNMQGFSLLNCWGTSNMCMEDKQLHDGRIKLDIESVTSHRLGTEIASHNEIYSSAPIRVEEDHACSRPMTLNVDVGTESGRLHAYVLSGIDGANGEQVEPASIAIDLIGTFENQLKSSSRYSSNYDDMSKSEFAPQLELSLRRFCSGNNNQDSAERHTLNHSNASAFSRYNNYKTLQHLPSFVGNSAESKADVNKSPEMMYNNNFENWIGTSQPSGVVRSNNQENMTSLITGQSGQADLAVPRPKVGSVSVSALRFDTISTVTDPTFTPNGCSPSGLPTGWSQSPFPVSSSVHSNAKNYDSDKGYHLSNETANPSVDQNVDNKHNLEPVEGLRHSSPAGGQSASSSLCNGFANHNSSSSYGGICSGSEKIATSATADERVTTTTPENLKHGGILIHDGFRAMNTFHSSQREAALTKFRMKRKDRCYEKKVRYQSRKRLAEQRPRVKGQFVRQAPTSAPIDNADGGP